MILNPRQDEIRPVPVPLPVIEALIAAHGLRKVMAAAAVAIWRGRLRKARPPDAAGGRRADLRGLNAHLRADIGLPPTDPAPPWAAGLPPGPSLCQPGARLG